MQRIFTRLFALATLTVTLAGCISHEKTSQPPAATFDASAITFDAHTIPVVILGGGIAGMTAALFVAQAKIPCVIFEGPKVGGSLAQSSSVRNWPGSIDSPGATIVGDLKTHVLAQNIPVMNEKVIGVDFSRWPREIQTINLTDPSKVTTWRALSVIIAMGKEPHLLGVPGESGSSNYWGKGISNCAPCDGSLYANKDVVVVGGGDAAIAEAAYLADIARTVTIIIRKDHFKARDIKAQERVLARSNVNVLFNTEVKSVEGDGKHVTHATLFNNQTQETSKMPLDGVFLAIGSGPNTGPFKAALELDSQGFIVLKNSQETSVHGVYAAGDIANPLFAQAIIASGDGCKAGLQTIKFIKETGFETAMVSAQVATTPIAPSEQRTSLLHDITSAQEFERLVTRSTKPVIIDVYATLCMSCKQLLPTLERIATTNKKIALVKLNMSNKALNGEMLLAGIGGEHVHTVPTLIFVNQGREIGRLVEVTDEKIINNKINELFNL
ncbi:MAG: FAD-dependent oxidoreductase [Candidatus Babeliales bacterium]|jgi:thioredoxin reductase (NADPH)